MYIVLLQNNVLVLWFELVTYRMLVFTSDSAVIINLFKKAILARSFRRDIRALFL